MSEITTKRLNADGSITVTDYADIISTIASRAPKRLETTGNALEINTKTIDWNQAANWEIDTSLNGGTVTDAESGGGVILTCNSTSTNVRAHLDMPFDLRNKQIILKIKALDALASEIDFYLFTGSRDSYKFWQGFGGGTYMTDVRTRDTYITLSPLSLSSGGGALTDLQDFRCLGVRLRLPSGAQTQLQIYEIKVVDTVPTPGAISIVFDDGWGSQYSKAYQKMKEHDMLGNIAVITGNVAGAPANGYCTLAQLQEMYNAGWDMVSHTKTHISLLGASLADVKTELRNSQQDLAGFGFLRSHKHFVYPGTAYDSQAIGEVKKLYRSARGLGLWYTGWPMFGDAKYHYGQSIYAINTTPVADITAMVDKIKQFGGYHTFTFHEIIDSPSTQYQYSTSNFNAVIDYIAASGIPVVRISDMFGESIPSVL